MTRNQRVKFVRKWSAHCRWIEAMLIEEHRDPDLECFDAELLQRYSQLVDA